MDTVHFWQHDSGDTWSGMRRAVPRESLEGADCLSPHNWGKDSQPRKVPRQPLRSVYVVHKGPAAESAGTPPMFMAVMFVECPRVACAEQACRGVESSTSGKMERRSRSPQGPQLRHQGLDLFAQGCRQGLIRPSLQQEERRGFLRIHHPVVDNSGLLIDA